MESIQFGADMYDKAEKTQVDKLRVANPWAITLLMKQLTGQLAAHSLHATFLDKAILDNGTVYVSCANWGASAKAIPVPFDAFANKTVGFVSAMP